jgi:transposase
MAKKQKRTGNGGKTKANKTLHHSSNNTGSLGRFTQFLTYKAEKVGKRVVRIAESHTSQEMLCMREACKKSSFIAFYHMRLWKSKR